MKHAALLPRPFPGWPRSPAYVKPHKWICQMFLAMNKL